MPDANAIIERLDALFVESLHIEVPSPDTDLLETGILDSLQFVELLLQLEQQFGCRISIEDIELDDLRTLARIAQVVAASAGTAAPPAARPSSRVAGPGAADAGGSVAEFRARSSDPRAEGAKDGGEAMGSGVRRAVPAAGRS